jgi:hypothetical protein
MLSVPTLAEMLMVIGVALSVTVVLVVVAGLLLNRLRSAPSTATLAVQIPAQRQGSQPTPVATR